MDAFLLWAIPAEQEREPEFTDKPNGFKGLLKLSEHLTSYGSPLNVHFPSYPTLKAHFKESSVLIYPEKQYHYYIRKVKIDDEN